jgi:diguanylate cyclase (GGDEF)-like protein/PAS domain S-box-containing protein
MKSDVDLLLEKLIHQLPVLAADESVAGRAHYETAMACIKLSERFSKVMAITDKYQAKIGEVIHQLRESNDALNRTQETLRQNEARLRLLTENMLDVIWLLDLGIWRLVYVSPSVYKLRGYTPEEVMSQPLDESLSPEFQKEIVGWLESDRDALSLGRTEKVATSRRYEYPTTCQDGSAVWTEALTNYLFDEHGMPSQILGVTRDISEQKAVEETLRYLATTDTLTNLPNRRLFLDRLDQERSRYMRYGKQGALLMLDLDRFKHVNDTHGHAVGDTVLRHVAQALLSSLRKPDFSGRLGGEEFAVFLPETTADGAMQFAERLRRKIAKTSIPAATSAITITLSIGVSRFSQDDRTTDDILARADSSLYLAKEKGRNRVASLLPGDQTRLMTETDLEPQTIHSVS